MKSHRLALVIAALLVSVPAHADVVNIDLSGASSGTSITTPQASFAQTFAGQTVSGTGLTGSPTGPLTLAPSGTLTVQFFDPGVSAASNSILSQPGNQAPLAILFASLADSFSFTMGSSDAGSTIDVRAYGDGGALTGSTQISMGSGYNLYSLTGLGTFRGLSFLNNNDPAGVRFQNMSYNSVSSVPPVPEPGTWAMMLVGFGAIGFTMRRRRATARLAAA